MKIILDIVSIVIFFVVYKYYDIFYATATMMAAYTLTFIISYYTNKKVDKTTLVTWLLVMILGGLTIFFHNEEYIKFKPTLIYLLFAIAFHVSPYFKDEKSIMERLAGHQLTLPKNIWNKLNKFWMFVFYTLGILNLYIAYNYTTQQWVYFKTFGIIGFLLVATLVQIMYMTKYIKSE
ncbi:MAG: septation protein IspZ [Gammaproteobacteria bacterium]|nr:septation protein IspZ [Gammaproteobacteria bacterium]